MAIVTPLQSVETINVEQTNQRASTWQRFRQHRMAMVALVVLGLMTILTSTAQLWTPYDPTAITGYAAGVDKNTNPGYVNPHNGDVYILGTDFWAGMSSAVWSTVGRYRSRWAYSAPSR